MFPTFQGPTFQGPEAGNSGANEGGPFHRMEAEEERNTIDWTGGAEDVHSTRMAASPGMASSPSSVLGGAAAAAGPGLEGYLAGMMSLAADAKLGAQVARVRLGLDARLRQACESQLLSRIGVASSLTREAMGGSGVVGGSGGGGREGGASPAEDEAGLRALIQESRAAQDHLRVVLGALEDYQRHRQGLADAAQRLGLALQEAGQRSPGAYGEALTECGRVHKQEASCRMEAHAVEELHVLSKLRSHHGKAAADCRKAVRLYEAARQELSVLRHARLEAQRAKEQASGDSPLTPTVEADAARLEEESVRRVKTCGDAVRGKLSMFEAKHAADYASSVASHMGSVAAEDIRVSATFADIPGALEAIRRAAPSSELGDR